MVESAEQREIVARLRAVAGPAPVILAGSRATGTAAADSDYDLFVVVTTCRLPRVIPRLRDAAADLQHRLGVEVSVNPLPAVRLRRPGRSLLVWKLRREGRVLAAPPGFTLGTAPVPQLRAPAAASYALSGLRFLTAALDPYSLRNGGLPVHGERAVRKALLHALQLRLLEGGRYAPTLPQALAALPAATRGPWVQAVRSARLAPGWVHARDSLLSYVDEPRRGRAATLVGNTQYVALRALRGKLPPPVALSARTDIGAAIAHAAVLIARAVRADGSIDERLVAAAASALPPFLLPRAASWAAIRNVVEAEWPHANPLVGL
jgi:predicted nucleotidyltransferase